MLIVGAAAVIVGAWSLHRVRVETATCQNSSTYHPGFGVGQTCLDQVWYNYLGFGLMLAGLFTVGFALLMMRKHHNIKGISGDTARRLIGTPGEDLEVKEALRGRYEAAPATTKRQWRPGYDAPTDDPPDASPPPAS